MRSAPLERPHLRERNLRVFICYAHRNSRVADELVHAIHSHGFEVRIDRRDLPFGEEWQAELRHLIRGSDVVVWLVSPESVRSRWCKWELGEVQRLEKRLVPIVISEIKPEELPEAIGKIHLLPSEGSFSPDLHLSTLIETLARDSTWIKEHTRLSELAQHWAGENCPKSLLLRGTALEQAEILIQRRPRDAPRPDSLLIELIIASRRSARQRQSFWLVFSIFATFFSSTLAWFAYSQMTIANRREEETRKVLARSDFLKANELASAAPGQALAHLARAIRSNSQEWSVARRALYLVADHAHALPMGFFVGQPIQIALDIPPKTDGFPQISPDGLWAVELGGNEICMRKEKECTSIKGAINNRMTLGEYAHVFFRGLAFPAHSGYVAISAGSQNAHFAHGRLIIATSNGFVHVNREYHGVVPSKPVISPNGRHLALTVISPLDGDGQSRTILYEVVQSFNEDGDELEIQLVELLTAHGAADQSAFSKDSRHVRLSNEWYRVRRPMLDQDFPVNDFRSAAFSSDASRLVVMKAEGDEVYLDARTARPVPRLQSRSLYEADLPAKNEQTRVDVTQTSIILSAGGKQVLSLGRDEIALVGESRIEKALLIVNFNGKAQVVSMADPRKAGEWRKLDHIYGLNASYLNWVNRVRSDERKNFVSTAGGRATLWALVYASESLASGRAEEGFSAVARGYYSASHFDVALHSDGRSIALSETGHSGGIVRLMDAFTGELLLNPIRFTDSLVALFFSKDGSWLGLGTVRLDTQGEFRMIDIATGLPLRADRLYNEVFLESPDRRRVLTYANNRKLKSFDLLGDSTAVPAWIADFLEAVGGWRIDDRSVLVPLTAADRRRRGREIRNEIARDGSLASRWIEFVQWYMNDAHDATISPYSAIRYREVESSVMR